MLIFFQVTDSGPTADWFPQSTILSSTNMPPSGTPETIFDKDISTTEGTEEDNSLDLWDITTPKVTLDKINTKGVENEIVAVDGRDSRFYEAEAPKEVTSENLFERTEVLAGKDTFPPSCTYFQHIC